MPRPKVKPEDRQRSARACLPCKASKIRCDAAIPCGPCSKRGRTSACTYSDSPRKRQKTDSQPIDCTTEAQFHHRGDSAVQTHQHDEDTPLARTDDPLQDHENSRFKTNSTQMISKLTESRLLLTSKGEKVFIGDSASLSFLQFLRQILRNYMGPSGFTEYQMKDSMLEIQAMHDESPVLTDQSRGEKMALVQMYREASSGILDLYTVEEVNGFLDRHEALSPDQSINEDSQTSRADQAALNMMLAIGCQCRGKKPVDHYNAARSFTCAQKFAFESFMCNPSIDIVRILIMMAYYMGQACHRNAAYMYTGIAARAACALGLHRKEHYVGLTPNESLVRWRTWKSVLILDTIISAILGRPSGIPALRPDDATTYDESEDMSESNRPRWLASRAVFAICSHIVELQQTLGNDRNVDIVTAESFLKRLRQWNESLPAELRHFDHNKDKPLRSAERELFMGATHASCLYYFSTILVTRPFMISHLMSTISRRQSTEPQPYTTPIDRSQIADLAQACLDAAVFLARTGYMAIKSSLLSKNMCLLKAWMFAAGLVLGFSMFIDSSEPVRDIDEAFHHARAVLECLAEASPQARHYLEILTALSDAIHDRRDQLVRERRRKSGRYVSQIFTADFGGSGAFEGGGARMDRTPSAGFRESTVDESVNDTSTYEFDDASYEFPDFAQQIDAWTDIPLLSDNLYFDWGEGDGWMKNVI